ncbi:MAG: hypothetical protein ACKOW9_00760 [Candidatus Paceibacterota bacterium]
MKRFRRYFWALGVLVFLGILIFSYSVTAWRAAELYGRPWVYLAWKLLVGGALPVILGAVGALFFFGAAQRSVRAAILTPISMFAASGLACVLAAGPLANTMLGPLTPDGQGTAIKVLHSAIDFRSRELSALVVTVKRDGNPGEQVNAFVSNGLMPSGLVELGTDRYGNTWVVEPPVSDSIRSQGWFLLFIAALGYLITFFGYYLGGQKRRSAEQ